MTIEGMAKKGLPNITREFNVRRDIEAIHNLGSDRVPEKVAE